VELLQQPVVVEVVMVLRLLEELVVLVVDLMVVDLVVVVDLQLQPLKQAVPDQDVFKVLLEELLLLALLMLNLEVVVELEEQDLLVFLLFQELVDKVVLE
tara:strand:- start:371 stop:670 length:300 start_codon:yes stop_codon:yes gene_type:complete